MSEMKFRVIADEGLGKISAVVGTLPVGMNLGEAREQDRVDYVLCHNAGNSAIDAGLIATPVGGGGAYSVTVSTVSLANDEYGAVVAYHATVPTGSFFWGAKKGVVALQAETASITTGSAFYLADSGTVKKAPQSVVTGLNFVGVTLTTVLSVTSGAGVKNGTAYINLP